MIDLNSRFDLHMHTYYCDGKNSPEEMVLAAIERGFDTVGISGHAWTRQEYPYCMTPAKTRKYISDVKALKNKYAGKINVLLGAEKGYQSNINNNQYDYTIGSIHCLTRGWNIIPIDANAGILRKMADLFCGGDMLSLAEMYYRDEGNIVAKTGCDIVGHFDIITKFIEEEPDLLDTSDPRYIRAWMGAIDNIFDQSRHRGNRLFDTGGKPVFEINTGAISRGLRTSPYPSNDQIDYIKSKGGILILSSDAHSKENVGYKFDEFQHLK